MIFVRSLVCSSSIVSSSASSYSLRNCKERFCACSCSFNALFAALLPPFDFFVGFVGLVGLSCLLLSLPLSLAAGAGKGLFPMTLSTTEATVAPVSLLPPSPLNNFNVFHSILTLPLALITQPVNVLSLSVYQSHAVELLIVTITLSNARTNSVSQPTNVRNNPLPSLRCKLSPSHAEERPLSAPSRLSPIVSAICLAAPFALFNSLRRFRTLSVPERNVLNAATLRLSVSSNASARSMPLSFKVFKPAIRSSRLLTGCPSACASFPFVSARFSNMFLVAVAALDASNPALANCPSNASTSSILKPKALATGDTVLIAFCRKLNDNADFVVLAVILSVNSCACVVSFSNIRRAAPVKLAASARLLPVACAKSNTDGAMLRMSCTLYPSFANSVCN